MTDLKSLLSPISEFVSTLDASDPAECEKRLNERFPPDGPEVSALRGAALEALESGEICDRGEPGMRFSRVVKPEHDPAGCSVDAVCMEDAAGPVHTHPKGEFCLCFPCDGEPTFEGRRDSWIVLASGSRHVPEVRNGRMLILYWLPEGAVVWN